MSNGESAEEASVSTKNAREDFDGDLDPEKAKKRLERYERKLIALRCPLVTALSSSELLIENYQLSDLLQRIIPELREYDTTLLKDFLDVLETKDTVVIQKIMCEVMSSIEDALLAAACGAGDVSAGDASAGDVSAGAATAGDVSADEVRAASEQRVVLCALLCAAVLAACPRARPALRHLLADTTADERVTLAAAWWRALPAAALLRLSDATRAPRRAAPPHAPSLAELLLRAALCSPEPQWELGAPRLEDLEAVVSQWEREGAVPEDATRVALCGRVLAVAPPALRPALLRRLQAARPALLDDKLAAARADRKVGVCKLQILFGADEEIKTPTKVKGKKPN